MTSATAASKAFDPDTSAPEPPFAILQQRSEPLPPAPAQAVAQAKPEGDPLRGVNPQGPEVVFYKLALDRLRSRLAEALRVAPARHATSPTRQARERRLQDKRRRGEVKRQRRRGALREQGDDA